jgi:hypothetical protein
LLRLKQAGRKYFGMSSLSDGVFDKLPHPKYWQDFSFHSPNKLKLTTSSSKKYQITLILPLLQQTQLNERIKQPKNQTSFGLWMDVGQQWNRNCWQFF